MDLPRIPTPSFVVDYNRLEENCRLLEYVQKAADCKIILAQKGFAMYSTYPLVSKYLKGTTASGIHEALLGYEEFGGEVHVYSPGFTEHEVDRLTRIVDHMSFNSLNQWNQFKDKVLNCGRKISCGLRVNPEYSEVEVALYDPCAMGSRLGILAKDLEGADLTGIEGLHFHVMCEQNSDTLQRVLKAFEDKFAHLIPQMKWINFGGGHHITRADYDVDLLIKLVRDFKEKWGKEVYLEPGEAIGLNTGVLVASVVDIVHNGLPIAILNISCTAHMPDVLEMPYRPGVAGAGLPDEKPYTYRLGGMTCLAGDVIGDYSFDQELKIGDKLVFLDMAHYTMVKTTTFNGVPLPNIAIWHGDEDRLEIVKKFGYEDYKMRL